MSHRCLFTVGSDRRGREQTSQCRETLPDSQRVPWRAGEVVGLQRTRHRKQRRAVFSSSALCVSSG